MIDLSFREVFAGTGDQGEVYRLAARWVRSNNDLEELAMFASDAEETQLRQATQAEELLNKGPVEPPIEFSGAGLTTRHYVYKGPGWIDNRWRQVHCSAGPEGYLLQVEGVGQFNVSKDGRRISHLSGEFAGAGDGGARNGVVEAMLGPGLILALALNGTWCWHASGAVFEDGAVVFLGESGSGKSTLAAYLGQQGRETWQWMVDDVLPLRRSAGRLEVLPHFPQLKVSSRRQPGPALQEQLPLRAIYVLGEKGEGEPKLTSMDAQESTLALVRHTVAARLFDDELLAGHLAFCALTASDVPVKRIQYRRMFEDLPLVSEALRTDLGATM